MDLAKIESIIEKEDDFSMKIKELLRAALHNDLGQDLWYYLHLANVQIRGLIPDYILFKHSYFKTHSEKPNFKNPQTFDEKQLWLKMHYRNPKCVMCSDKYLVRQYVKDKGYATILNQLYAVYENVDDVEWDKLPNRFYIKANHASGCNARCDDPTLFDRAAAIKRLKRGMRHDYSKDSHEWNYGKIKRRIIVEKIIEAEDGSPLVDYRFLCANGHCSYVFVDIGTAGTDGKHLEDAQRNVYDRDFNLLDVRVGRDRFSPELIKRPTRFKDMLSIAESLSEGFPFCRVDLYEVDGRILFGEITFFHAGGICEVTPKSWETKLGEDISIEFARKQIADNYGI